MIIGSCGHKVRDFGNHIIYKAIDRYGDMCEISSVVCDECLIWYIKEMKAEII